MCPPRRRATYPAPLVRAYDQAITAIVAAIRKPIQYAGPEQWSLFPRPEPFGRLAGHPLPLPGTTPADVCPLRQAFHRLSLYVEALCIHEWCLFSESVTQDAATPTTRGHLYIERCFKAELIDGSSFTSLADATVEIGYYIAYHKAERRYSALASRLPSS